MTNDGEERSASDFPYSPSQVRRAGDRIRRAAQRHEAAQQNDLALLDEYRAWHQPTLERCQRELVSVFHERLELDPETFAITGRPLKTVEAITAKLVRGTRLNTMRDIAGTRIVVPALDVQDAVTALVLETFKGHSARIEKDTRVDGDESGYRALHVVSELDNRFAEIQVRTKLQDAWAQMVERVDKMLRTDLKHGNGPADWGMWLLETSNVFRKWDIGEYGVDIPPTPYDHLLGEEPAPA